MARKRTRKKKQDSLSEIPKLDSLKQLNLNAAGLDIGAEEIYACVPEDRDSQSVRVFSAFTIDLYALADWLQTCGVDTVAMESTGIYWIPIYEILEERGFEVFLVNARQIKNVSGRKTDILDCQWIQQLHTYGLLRASFRPSEDICALRSLVRHRDNLIRYRSAHTQHMQKALNTMNLKLTNVVSDVTGVTGLKIIRDIVAGVHNPNELARHRDYRCKKSEKEIAKSLHGNYRAEHIFELRQALELFDFYNLKIKACDDEIQDLYAAFEPQVDVADNPLPPGRNPRGNEPEFDLRSYLYRMTGVDLTRINGIDVLTAQTVVSEIGLDMSKWKSVKHFASWLGLSPNNQITGGKIIRRSTKRITNRAAQALRMSALALTYSDSALGVFFRRMRAKHGAPKAITATAHKLARIIYFMLKRREEYVDPGASYYQEKYRERVVKNLEQKADKLGYKLVPNEA